MNFCMPYFRWRRIGPRSGGGGSFLPSQVCAAYGFPKIKPVKRVAIGILELGGGYQPSDTGSAFGNMNLPAPAVSDFSFLGAQNSPGDAADGEVALDIQVAAAAYSYCTGQPADVRMIWCPNTNQGFAGVGSVPMAWGNVDASCVSISWGGPEDTWGSAIQGVESSFAQLAAARICAFAASGDNGSGDGESGNHADYPSSSPNVVGCGATNLRLVNGLPVESVWNDGRGDGTGGGFSAVFPRPAFQQAIPFNARPTLRNIHLFDKRASGMRMVPDVAGDGDPATGYQIVLNGQVGIIGGTSAVAPLWAGFYAALLAGGMPPMSAGDFLSKLYASQGLFNDITTGDNGAFQAGVGPDPCTGMGTPRGAQMAQALLGVPGSPPVVPPVVPPPVIPPPVPALPVGRDAVMQCLQGAYGDTKRYIEKWALSQAAPAEVAWMDRHGW